MVIDLPGLQALIAIADHPRMADAAEALHLSQPAVSKRLSELERRLSMRLFDRVGKELQLTPAGRTLLAEARGFLAEHQRLEQLALELGSGVQSSLRLATSHHIGLHLLPPVLRQLRSELPQLKLTLKFMDSDAAYSAVHSGEVDIALATLDPGQTTPLQTVEIWQDQLRWWVHPSHALARRAEPLNQHLALMPQQGTYTRELVESALGGLGEVLVSNYLETLAAMVDAGLGWSVLPERLVRDGWVDLGRPALHRTLGALIDPRREQGMAARRLIEICQS